VLLNFWDRKYFGGIKRWEEEAFSLEFWADLVLPSYVGLGKGCSLGWAGG